MCKKFESHRPWAAIPGNEGDMSPAVFRQGGQHRDCPPINDQVSVLHFDCAFEISLR